MTAVFGLCAAAAALSVGLAEPATASSGAPSSSTSNSVVTVLACPGGLTVGVLGIGVTVGQVCQTAPATPMPAPSTTPTGGGLPTPSTGPTEPTSPQPTETEPEPTAVGVSTLPSPPPPSPRTAVAKASPTQAAVALVIPPTPRPTPTQPEPTAAPPLKPHPRAAPIPATVQLPTAYHAVPFHKVNPVLVVFVVAIVPVTLARVRRRNR